MAHADFVHLRVHSAYSLLEGAIRVPDLVKLAADRRMPAVAMTDTNNMFGAMEFSSACAGAGIQPILGCQVAIARERERDDKFRAPTSVGSDGLILLAQNEAGYKNLLKLLKTAFLDSADDDEPHVPLDALQSCSEGVIALTGGPSGPVGRLLGEGRFDASEAVLLRLKEAFPERLYVEVMRHGMPIEAEIEGPLVDLAYAHDLPLVATNEAFFSEPDMYDAHDALICIAEGKYVSEDDRRRLTREHGFKNAEEMRTLFADLPEAVDNTLVIARRCAVMVEKIDPILPPYDCGEGRNEADELLDMARRGLEIRLKNQVLTDDMTDEVRAKTEKKYFDRLDEEKGRRRRLRPAFLGTLGGGQAVKLVPPEGAQRAIGPDRDVGAGGRPAVREVGGRQPGSLVRLRQGGETDARGGQAHQGQDEGRPSRRGVPMVCRLSSRAW